MNNQMIDLALSYLKRGWSVIPCGKDKRPSIAWKEFQTRRATEQEVRKWFEIYPEAQVGIVTGKISNLTVVDIEGPDPEKGEPAGDPTFLPQDTMIGSTGGGGYHYFFLYSEGERNKVRIKNRIDFRSEGGYVVAPGSSSAKGPYVLLQDVPLLPFPKELFPETVDVFNLPSSGGIKFEKREMAPYHGFGKGQRNDGMARRIGYVLTQIHPADWETEAWYIIQSDNNLNTPPLSPYELRSTFESIKRIERTTNPLGRSNSSLNTLNTFGSGNSSAEPVILSEEGDEIKHLADVAEGQVLNQDDVYPLQMPCFDDVINGGVSPGDLIVVGGQTGHGKTTLVQDWSLSLIRGEKKTKALWFSYEVLASHLWKKFQEMGMTREDCAFIPLKHTTGGVAWVEEKIKEGKEKFGTKAVFIDHLGFLLPKTSSILGGSKMSTNYSTFLTQIARDLKSIAIKEEIVIFLPVHVRKPEKGKKSDVDDIKDSSGIGQEADLVFMIEREKSKDTSSKSYFTDTTTISLVKNRKTGTTVIGKFNMIKGRFAYDDSEDKANALFESLGEKLIDEGSKADIPPAPMVFPYKDIPEDKDDKEEDEWETTLKEFNDFQ